MFVYEREIRFHEADAAGLVFFPCFFVYAHEAMEQMFCELEGGYANMILGRRLGLPAVKVQGEFEAPLRYGDIARLEVRVPRLGNRSFDLEITFLRAADGVRCAVLRHTVVTTDLSQVVSTDMPEDVRRVVESHRASP